MPAGTLLSAEVNHGVTFALYGDYPRLAVCYRCHRSQAVSKRLDRWTWNADHTAHTELPARWLCQACAEAFLDWAER